MTTSRRLPMGIAAVATVVLLIRAFRLRFLMDDAFIFMRYARHFDEGHGLVWNLGERVEGYTSLLWVHVLGLLQRLPAPPVEVSVHIVTLALAAATLGLAYYLASAIGRTPWAGALAVALLSTDRTFAVWSTSGMETRLWGFLALAMAVVVERIVTMGSSHRRTALLAGCAALITVTRPEGVTFTVLAFAVLAWNAWRTGRSLRILAGPAAVWIGAIVALEVWRYAYYGALLPNTFHAKVTGVDVGDGGHYLFDFALIFPLLTIGILAGVVAALSRYRREPAAVYVAVALLVHVLYMLLVGGDFMEFRMLDVVIPFGYTLLAVWLVDVWHRRRLAVAAIVFVVATANAYADETIENHRYHIITRLPLAELTTDYWVVIGKWFHEHALPDETIATTAAGAIPYYSGLRCLDMLGLNDPFVAAMAPDPDEPVGHRRVAPESYIRSRRITYVIGHPQILQSPDERDTGGDHFIIRIENPDASVNGGRDFYLYLRTADDKEALVTSLRKRGVEVFE